MFDVLHLYFTSVLEVMAVISHDAAGDLWDLLANRELFLSQIRTVGSVAPLSS